MNQKVCAQFQLRYRSPGNIDTVIALLFLTRTGEFNTYNYHPAEIIYI